MVPCPGESNTKMNLLGEKELAHKLGMLVWEGDQKHLPSFIIQTKERRREGGVEVIRGLLSAGSAVDDRVMLTAGREYCRRSNDAHGRTPGVL